MENERKNIDFDELDFSDLAGVKIVDNKSDDISSYPASDETSFAGKPCKNRQFSALSLITAILLFLPLMFLFIQLFGKYLMDYTNSYYVRDSYRSTSRVLSYSTLISDVGMAGLFITCFLRVLNLKKINDTCAFIIYLVCIIMIIPGYFIASDDELGILYLLPFSSLFMYAIMGIIRSFNKNSNVFKWLGMGIAIQGILMTIAFYLIFSNAIGFYSFTSLGSYFLLLTTLFLLTYSALIVDSFNKKQQ